MSLLREETIVHHVFDVTKDGNGGGEGEAFSSYGGHS